MPLPSAVGIRPQPEVTDEEEFAAHAGRRRVTLAECDHARASNKAVRLSEHENDAVGSQNTTNGASHGERRPSGQ